MRTYHVRVAVTLKPEILDPAGQATREVLVKRGHRGLQTIRIGRLIDLEIDAESSGEALAEGERMGREVLANPVLETFRAWVEHDAD